MDRYIHATSTIAETPKCDAGSPVQMVNHPGSSYQVGKLSVESTSFPSYQQPNALRTADVEDLDNSTPCIRSEFTSNTTSEELMMPYFLLTFSTALYCEIKSQMMETATRTFRLE